MQIAPFLQKDPPPQSTTLSLMHPPLLAHFFRESRPCRSCTVWTQVGHRSHCSGKWIRTCRTIHVRNREHRLAHTRHCWRICYRENKSYRSCIAQNRAARTFHPGGKIILSGKCRHRRNSSDWGFSGGHIDHFGCMWFHSGNTHPCQHNSVDLDHTARNPRHRI